MNATTTTGNSAIDFSQAVLGRVPPSGGIDYDELLQRVESEGLSEDAAIAAVQAVVRTGLVDFSLADWKVYHRAAA